MINMQKALIKNVLINERIKLLAIYQRTIKPSLVIKP